MVRAGGREYFYFHAFRGTKRAGERTPLPGCPQHPNGTVNNDWWETYRRLAGEPEPAPRAGSFASLVKEYRTSPEWAQLAENTRVEYARYAAVVDKAWGSLDVRAVEPKHVLKLRDAYADVPPADEDDYTKPLEEYLDRKAASNGLLAALSAMLSWGIPRGWRTDNPVLHVPKLKGGDGYVAWPWRAVEHYRKHATTHLWWVAAHALYTGQRQGDVLAMVRNHVSEGEISVKQEKTGKRLWIPLHRDLKVVQGEMQEALRKRREKGAQVVATHLLLNSRNERWTQDGFRASWQTEFERRVFRPFKTHRLVFHGLRKSAVVCLIEAGCTTAEVAAITGQTMKMIEHYAQQVNQRKLARTAILKWEREKGT